MREHKRFGTDQARLSSRIFFARRKSRMVDVTFVTALGVLLGKSFS